MKTRTFLFALMLSWWAHADEIIPGVVAFTPPAGFDSVKSGGGPSDNPFGGVGELREYLSQNGKQINVNARVVGFSIGNGKRVTYRQLDDNDVKQEMLSFSKSLPNITNITAVTDSILGGQKAFSFTFHAIVREYGKHIYGDYYWVRIDTNRVVEVELTSTVSDAALIELRKSLSGFTIKKSYSK